MDNANATKTTAAGQALLAKLPSEFILEEDFRASNAPGSIVQTMDGRLVFKFTKGDWATFKKLMRDDVVVRVDSRTVGLLVRAVFMVA